MSDIKVTEDHVNPKIRYLAYEMPGDGVGTMDLGDGTSRPVFPPRGQVTHVYEDGEYTVKVKRDGKTMTTGRVTVGNPKRSKK